MVGGGVGGVIIIRCYSGKCWLGGLAWEKVRILGDHGIFEAACGRLSGVLTF